MNIVDPEIVRYLDRLMPEREAPVVHLEKQAADKGFPIVGPQVGRLCLLLCQAIAARRVFELGSGFGYSTYWFARAVGENGRVHFTDYLEDHARQARDFLSACGLAERVAFHVGDALEILQQVEGQFDVIFNDADKEHYPDSLDLILPRLRPGGLLITDNMLWHGRVVAEQPDHEAQAIVEYTRRLLQSEQLVTVVLPLRDGVGLSYKTRG